MSIGLAYRPELSYGVIYQAFLSVDFPEVMLKERSM